MVYYFYTSMNNRGYPKYIHAFRKHYTKTKEAKRDMQLQQGKKLPGNRPPTEASSWGGNQGTPIENNKLNEGRETNKINIHCT